MYGDYQVTYQSGETRTIRSTPGDIKQDALFYVPSFGRVKLDSRGRMLIKRIGD